MFSSSECLLVLIVLQSSENFLTAQNVSDITGIPVAKAEGYLNDLVSNKYVESFAVFTNENGEQVSDKASKKTKKKGVYGYVINYKTAIESIVYRYQKCINNFSVKQDVEEPFYKCQFHDKKYRYSEALEFFFDGDFECPECYKPMFIVKEEKKTTVLTHSAVCEQFKELKADLDKLKEMYSKINDYPIMMRPESKNKTAMSRANHVVRGSVPSSPARIFSNERLPWEDAEESTEVFGKKDVDENFIDLSKVDFMSFSFLQPNKTFTETVEVVCKSPDRPTHARVIVPTRKVPRRRNFVNATSMQMQM